MEKEDTASLRWKNAARLPDYIDGRIDAAKSRQLWVARPGMVREIKRNSGTPIGYRPAYAERQTLSRRWRGGRLERNASLRDDVLGRLSCGCSPRTEWLADWLILRKG
jgi:IS30 family transposase